MDVPPQSEPRASGDLAYAYKPSLLGTPVEFRLTAKALEWRRGRHAISIPYDRIRRLRLSFRPVSMQSHRFLAEVWPVGGPKLQICSTSWRSIVEQERHDADYTAFITELHRRIAAAGAEPTLEAGTPVVVYWLGFTVFAGASLALAALIARALQAEAYAGAAIVAGFLALFLWQVGTFLRRNRPGTYRADALPPLVLPQQANGE
ncbi:MAG TPA: hypothetical protein VKE26_16495 [Xanthobacteraceae bacterium]|nr:hypothetical protein [Xanthobacteraceae bacterium]